MRHPGKLTHDHLTRSTSLDKNIATKDSYKQLSSTYNIEINSYIPDNGHCAEQLFRNSFKDANQTWYFCGVGPQNGNFIVEHKNKQLTFNTRTMLVHENRH